MSVAETCRAALRKFRPPRNWSARARALAPKLRERAVTCRARPQHSARVGRGISRRRPHPHHAAQALGRLRARPRGRLRHRDRARQIDLRLVGLVPELSERPRRHPRAFPGRGAARRLEPRTRPPASPPRRRRPARRTVAPGGYRLDGNWSWCSGLRHSQWIMIGGLVFRERRAPSRHAAVPGAGHGGQAARHLVLRGLARHRLEHVGARQCVRARAPQRVVLDLARRLLAGLAGQHQSDLPHAVHRRAHLRAARPGARARPRRLCRVRAMDAASAISPTRSSPSPSTCRCRSRSPRSRAQIDAAELLARRCLATARQNYAGMTMETRILLRRDFTYAMQHAARRDGCADQDQRLQRTDGRQSGAALLARRARHLLARGDELGRAGGEFRPHGVRARAATRPIRRFELKPVSAALQQSGFSILCSTPRSPCRSPPTPPA